MDGCDRHELAELIREDDRLRAERASEQAAAALVRKSQPEGLLYRTHDGNAPAPATYDDGEASDVEERFAAINEFSKAVVERFRMLDRENAELRGKLDAVLTLIGKSEKFTDLKSADIHDLPNWRSKHVA